MPRSDAANWELYHSCEKRIKLSEPVRVRKRDRTHSATIMTARSIDIHRATENTASAGIRT